MIINISESKLPQHPHQNQKRRKRQRRTKAASVQNQQVVRALCHSTSSRDDGSQGVGDSARVPGWPGGRRGGAGAGPGGRRSRGGGGGAGGAHSAGATLPGWGCGRGRGHAPHGRPPPRRAAAPAALVRGAGAAVARARVPGRVPGAERQLGAAGAGAVALLGTHPEGEARPPGRRLGAAGGRAGGGVQGPGRPAPAGLGE